MEATLQALVKNRTFIPLIFDLTESVKKLSNIGFEKVPGGTEDVINSLLRILDAADNYELSLQKNIEPMKHKLKVSIAELRNASIDKQSLPSLLNTTLSESLQLLVALDEFEKECLRKAYDAATLHIQALETLDISENMDIVPPLLGALRHVLPFLQKVQSRSLSLPERSHFERLIDTAAVQKFYLQFLADTFRLFAKHSGSRYMKILWSFCVCQAGQWLSKLCDCACGTSPQHALKGWMGAFVEKVDEALYRLSRKVGEEFYLAVDSVVSHGMSVCQLCAKNSKEKLYPACKQVLEAKHDLQNALEQPSKNKMDGIHNKMKKSLEDFEEIVNISLVELIVKNYMKPSSSLSKLLVAALSEPLHEHGSSSAGMSDVFKAQINHFCSAVDLIYSIAHLAAGCTTDARSVSRLWNHLHLMEFLDPELVAAVVSLAGDKDEALLKALGQLQHAWNFHVRSLFKSLILLTDHEAFFTCLDDFFKESIADLDCCLMSSPIDQNYLIDLVGDMAVKAGSALDLITVVLEGSDLPEALQIAMDNLNVARNALKAAPAEKALKRAKVIRGCLRRVQEHLNEHLEFVSHSSSRYASHFLTGIRTTNVTVNKTFSIQHLEEPSLDLNITELLEGMQSTTFDKSEQVTKSILHSTVQKFCPPELSFRALHCNLPEVSRRIKETSSFDTKGNDLTGSSANFKDVLKCSLWVSHRSFINSSLGRPGWMQNNSTVYSLVRELEEIVAKTCDSSETLERDAVTRLGQTGSKLAAELADVCSRLDPTKCRNMLRAEVNRVQREIDFNARQLHLFAALGSSSCKDANGAAPLARNLLLVASESVKLLQMLCTQEHGCMDAMSDMKLELPSHQTSSCVDRTQNGSTSSA